MHRGAALARGGRGGGGGGGGEDRGDELVHDTLHAEDADEEEEQADPLVGREALAEEAHAEDGGEEDLGLVGHLCDGRLEVRRAHEQHHVLHRVEQRGHGELQPLERVVAQVDPERGQHRAHAMALLGVQQRAHAQLDQLLHHHRSEVGVGLAPPGLQQLGVAHEQDRARALQREDEQRAPLLPAGHRRRLRRRGRGRERLALLGLALLELSGHQVKGGLPTRSGARARRLQRVGRLVLRRRARVVGLEVGLAAHRGQRLTAGTLH
mmetsp:Transcript_19492/g.49086  ORF Transcript_19492/g.49086 Transcript_19492/m.49086 type:complete len:266 (-) Transcript_19492:13-810(-)